MATASKTKWYITQEAPTPSDFGVMPTSPTFLGLRNTSCTIDEETDEATSAEMSGDRRPGYSRGAASRVNGDIASEITYGADVDLRLQASYAGSWSSKGTKTATTLSVTASTRTIGDSASGIDTSAFEAGDKITITGFTTAGNNVVAAEILSVTSAGIVLTTATTTLADEAAGDSVTITNNTQRLKAGTNFISLAAMKHQTDITTGAYQTFVGLLLNTCALSIEPNGFATITNTVLGLNRAEVADSAPSGATMGSLTTTKPMNAIETVLTVDGTTVVTATKLDATLDNGLSHDARIGSAVPLHTDDPNSIKSGNIKITGTLSIAVDDGTAEYITKLKNRTEVAMSSKLVDVAGNAYKFVYPKIIFTKVPTNGSGDGLIISDMTWTAHYDTATGCVAYIDKIPA